MPKMPSGRHVAIDATPIYDLLDNWIEEASHQEFLRIREVKDMFPYVRILELVPSEFLPQEKKSAQKSNPFPVGLSPRDTGRRLSGWPIEFDDWTSQDRSAFQIFLDERLIDYLGSTLIEAKDRESELVKTFGASLEAAWTSAGVHPSQEPGWDDLPDSAELDEYDAILALGQCVAAFEIGAADTPPRTKAVDRLDGFWAMACQDLAWLPQHPDPLECTTDLAAIVRQDSGFSRLPADRHSWWKTQAAIECVNLWNDSTLEPFFMLYAPKAWGVVKTINLMTPLADE